MPKPVLQAMVLADHIYQDRSTGKHIIAGTFTTIFIGSAKVTPAPDSEGAAGRHTVSGPITRAGSPYLYIALVEVHGEVPLELKLVDLSDASVLMEAQVVVASNDPIAVAEFVLPLPILPASKIGTFSLDLLHGGEFLGSWRISVKEMEQPEESGAEQ